MALVIKALLWLVTSFLLIALTLFLAAGTIFWLAAWIDLILLHGFMLIGILLLLKSNPGLLAERISLSQSNQKTWDKLFIAFFELCFFAWLVLMALDAVRFHWSHMPLLLQVLGGMALLASCLFIGLTFRENSFLSPRVRIQEDREQTVISSGPYHYVRHPLYASGFLLFFGTTLLLGSWYGLLVIVLVMLPGCLVRAVLEERTLCNELPGYDAYMVQVKYRLIPYIW